MNDKLGKIGLSEAASITAIAACASGIFTPESTALYAKGNSAYVSIPLAAGLSLSVFLLVLSSMKKEAAYYDFLRDNLDKTLGGAVSLITSLILVFSASMLIDSFLVMLSRFVFAEATQDNLLIYIGSAIAILAWLGLEGLGRTARLFFILPLLTVSGALILASGGYELYRLAPYMGDGIDNTLSNTLYNTLAFLPAFISLLVVKKGAHTGEYTKKAGITAGIIAISAVFLCQLCIGLSFPYGDLSAMNSPMYNLTMDFKLGAYFPELDTLLFFGWLIAAIPSAAFYIYAASLLFTQSFKHGDIRPSIAAWSICALDMALYIRSPQLESTMPYIKRFAALFLLIPSCAFAILAQLRNKKRGEFN